MRCNGFLTAYMIWFAAAVLVILTGADTLSRLYLNNAQHYAEAIRLDYVAESMLLTEWQEFTETPWRSVPRKQKRSAEDNYNLAGENHELEIYITSNNPQVLPFTGFFRVAAENTAYKQKRSCGIRFSVEAGDDGEEEKYTVIQQKY